MGYSNVAGDLNVYSTTMTQSLTVQNDTTLAGNLAVLSGTANFANVVASKLTVTGNFIVTATNTSSTNALSVNNSGTTTAMKVVQYEGGGPGHLHNVAEFWDYTTLAMVIDPRGNVAIHTTASPGYALTVNQGALFDNVTSGYFIGDGSNVTNIQAVQVTGGLSTYQLQAAQTNITSVGTLTNLAVSGTIYGTIAGSNTVTTSGLYGPVVGANTVAASTVTATTLVGTHYGPLVGANTITGTDISGTSLYGPLVGANTIAATTITGTSLIGTHYGPLAGANTISGSSISGTTLYGPLSGANTITGTSISGTTLYGPLAGANTAAASGFYGPIVGSNTIAASTITATNLVGTHYGPLAGANTIAASTVTATNLVGTHYGPLAGANTIAASTVTATNLVGTHYGPISGSNTIVGSTIYGTLAGANTITGSSISGTSLYGPIVGSNTVAASTVTATSLVGTHYGPLAGANTIAASTVTASDFIGNHYGTVSGSNTIAASTVTATSLVGTHYGPLAGANTIAASTVTASDFIGNHYGTVSGSNTIAASTVTATSLVGTHYGPIAGSNTIVGSTIYGPLAGANTVAASTVTATSLVGTHYGPLAGANTIAASTVTATSLVGTHYGPLAGANTIAASTVTATSLVGTHYGPISGSNTIVGSTIYGTLAGANTITGSSISGTTLYGTIAGANTVTASTIYGTIAGANTIAASSLTLGTALSLGNGGTGQTTAAAAITALTGTQVSGKYIRSDGTNATLSTLDMGDAGAGTLAVARGGTGTTSSTGTGSVVLSAGSTLTGTTSIATLNLTNVLGTLYGGTGADGSAVTANKVLASPDGSAGGVTYRSLVSVDLPTVTFSPGSAGTYGSTTAIPTIVVDTYGRITGISTSSITTLSGLTTNGVLYGTSSSTATTTATGTAGQPLLSAGSGSPPAYGTLGLAYGGTGQTSAQTSINTLAGAVTAGSYLRGDGTNVVMSTIQVADVPTLNQNTTGSAGSLSTTFTSNYILYGQGTGIPGTSASLTWDGTSLSAGNIIGTHYGVLAGSNTISGTTLTLTNALGIAYGGTGQTTAATAFNALSPMTTLGDLIYGAASGAGTRLAGNTTGTKNFLIQTGTGTVSTAPSWGTLSATDLPIVTFSPGSAGTYGSTTSIPTIVVDTYGRITGISTSSITTLSGLTTNGVLYASSATTAATTAVGTTGQPLLSGGIGASPTYGTLSVAYGGTGQTTEITGFNALSPMTTLGDLIYGAALGSGTRLAGSISATAAFLSQTGTGTASAAPVWTLATGTGSVVLSASPTLSGTITGGTFAGTHTGDGSGVTNLNMGNAASGTLAIARGGTGLTSTSQNFVFAGPTSGAGAPSFRILATGDIPTLNQNTTGSAGSLSATLVTGSGGTGLTSFTSGGLLYASSTSALASSGAYTAGQVLYGGGAGAAPGSSSGLFWDSANSRLGIGTATNLNSRLVVYNSASTSTYTGTTAWGNLHLMPQGTDNSWAGITFGGSGGGAIQQSTQASIVVDSNSTNGTKMRFNVGYLFANGALERMTIIGETGNVGIGTNNPSSYKLQVAGTVGSSTSFTRITGSTATAFNAPGTGLASTDYNLILAGANDTANRLVVFVNGSTRTADGGASNVIIRNDGGSLILGNASFPTIVYGNVGIGTTSPYWTLCSQYAGNNDSSTTAKLNFGAQIHNTTASGANNRPNLILFTDLNSTQGAMGGFRQIYNNNYLGGLVFYIGSQPVGYLQGTPTTTAAASGSLTEAMRINPNGNVGIGTNNPGTALQVNGTVTATTFSGSAASLTSFPTLNQNTTGSAATAGTATNQSGGTVSCTSASSSGYIGTVMVPGVGARSTGGFYVYNDGNFNIEMMQRTSGVYGLNFITRNTDGVFSWRKTGGATDWGTELMFLNNAGNLAVTGTVTGTGVTASGAGQVVLVSGGSNPGYVAIYNPSNTRVAYMGWQAATNYISLATENGYVGYNVTGALLVNGEVTAFYSDDRLKTKTGKLENALNKVCSLDGFTYVNNELANSFGFTDEDQQVGLSAQQVQKILPEVIRQAPFDQGKKTGENYLTIKYERVVPLLVEALKEERAERLKVEERLARLEKLLLKE